jgi:mycothiol synthase
MADQLQMIWPETRMAPGPEWQAPAGYLLRGFRVGDEEAYLDLMHSAGFDTWNRDNLNAVLANAVPHGVVFVEHVASSKIVATAMGWRRPSSLFPDAYEMGWVAADPAHTGMGLGQVVIAAATRALLEHGAGRIYLLTDDWRLPAIKSYLKVGYVPLYHQPGMKDRWQELFLKLNLIGESGSG